MRTVGGKRIALTIDDGPSPTYTPQYLRLLAKLHIKAVFCVIGDNVRRYPNLVKQIVAGGHVLCNHTMHHDLHLGTRSASTIHQDITATTAAIMKASGGVRPVFFRAPGGNFTDRLVQVAYADEMTSLYWQVDPRDWSHPEGEDDTTHVGKVVDGVREHVQPGSIVLSHDFNQPDTILAYEQLLPWLTENFELGIPDQPPAPTAAAPAGPASSL